MKRLLTLAFAAALLVAITASAQEFPSEVIAVITNVAGEEIGSMSVAPLTADMARDMSFPPETLEGAMAVWIQVQGLTPGFHGIHIHSVGTCDTSGERAFASAGGHLHADGETHGQHMGDLPSLLVTQGGAGVLVFAADGFTLDDLLDADGSAVIIHAGPDNYGNIPAERYDPDADETTLNTGDAGGRVACGVFAREG